MTESEFRSDEAAVKELNTFLNSKTGVKFLNMLQAESVLKKLCSAENQSPANVRDLALAESGENTASILLGRCIGYGLALEIVERARELISKPPAAKDTAATKVARTLRK